MKVLFVVSFLLGVGFWGAETSNFNYESYIEDSAVVDMLNAQFVADYESEDLVLQLEGFMVNHFDKIDHVSGHFAKESGMYYYTMYGSKNGEKKFDLIEVDKSNFESASYYDYKEAASLYNLCRRGNGYPYPPVCPGTACQNWPKGGCLGIICPRTECL